MKFIYLTATCLNFTYIVDLLNQFMHAAQEIQLACYYAHTCISQHMLLDVI